MASVIYPSCIPELIRVGFIPIPGLRTYGLQLTPAASEEAWALLMRAQHLISQQDSAQEERWTFDDDGNLRSIRGFMLKDKPDKSSITVTKKTADVLSRSTILPEVLRHFFENAAYLMAAISDTLADIAPAAPFPTMINLRLFAYRTSELAIVVWPVTLMFSIHDHRRSV